jgi:hypothetical protein
LIADGLLFVRCDPATVSYVNQGIDRTIISPESASAKRLIAMDPFEQEQKRTLWITGPSVVLECVNSIVDRPINGPFCGRIPRRTQEKPEIKVARR